MFAYDTAEFQPSREVTVVTGNVGYVKSRHQPGSEVMRYESQMILVFFLVLARA